VNSVRIDMLPHCDSQQINATVTLTNGKVYEGWTDEAKEPDGRKFSAAADKLAKDAAKQAMPAAKADEKALKGR
jgi:hypothetical protein